MECADTRRAGLACLALVLMLSGVFFVAVVHADTIYNVSFSWSDGFDDMPASGNGNFIISFDPAGGDSTGTVEFQSLTGFAWFTSSGIFNYEGATHVLKAYTITDYPYGPFLVVTDHWDQAPAIAFKFAELLYVHFPGAEHGPIRTYVGSATATVVPGPGTLLLLSSGLLGMVGVRRLWKG